jgi:hypothetical protein
LRAGQEKVGELVLILEKYFNVPTKISEYGDALNTKMLKQHKILLNGFLGIQQNMCFVPMTMKMALIKIATDKQKVWKFSEKDIEDFAAMVGKRLRTMCRHISQNMLKTKSPKWLSEVLDSTQKTMEQTSAGSSSKRDTKVEVLAPSSDGEAGEETHGGDEDEEEEAEEEEVILADADDEDEEKEPSKEYLVGWDDELGAWRLEEGQPPSQKEFAIQVLGVDAGASDDSPIVARLG